MASMCLTFYYCLFTLLYSHISWFFFFLIIRRPPRSTRTDTLFPYTTLFRSATGIDAMVHAIESYTSKKLKNPLSDMLAVKALTLLSTNLLRACEIGRAHV